MPQRGSRNWLCGEADRTNRRGRIHGGAELSPRPGRRFLRGIRRVRWRDECTGSAYEQPFPDSRFARYEGVWTIAEQDGLTHVTYALSAKPSFGVPAFLLKRLLTRDANHMIERLKAEISARALQPATAEHDAK
jgi:hypothetical protein